MKNLIADFEKRFDEQFKITDLGLHHIPSGPGMYSTTPNEDIKSFLIQELKHLVEEIVPEEKQDDTHPSAAAAWNLCRQKMLNRIKEL